MKDAELKALFEETWRQIAETNQRLDGTNQRLEEKTADLRRHFDVTVERWETRFAALTEWVATKDELHALESRLENKIEEKAVETQALIRFAFTNLDRRVTKLEARDARRRRVASKK